MPRLVVGQSLVLHRNQALRDAIVLAVKGDVALAEYVMPAGSSALNLLRAEWTDTDEPTLIRSISYASLGEDWLTRIVVGDEGDWIGNPQQGDPLPTPAELLEARRRLRVLQERLSGIDGKIVCWGEATREARIRLYGDRHLLTCASTDPEVRSFLDALRKEGWREMPSSSGGFWRWPAPSSPTP